jgi:hypothetical protein
VGLIDYRADKLMLRILDTYLRPLCIRIPYVYDFWYLVSRMPTTLPTPEFSARDICGMCVRPVNPDPGSTQKLGSPMRVRSDVKGSSGTGIFYAIRIASRIGK